MIRVDDITEMVLRENDGVLTWTQDDYLSMRGYAEKDPETLEILDRVAELKQQMREAGYVFLH